MTARSDIIEEDREEWFLLSQAQLLLILNLLPLSMSQVCCGNAAANQVSDCAGIEIFSKAW